jgi:membrane protease YdiL (CAAX protease family)
MELIAVTRLLQLSAVIGLAAGRNHGLRDLGLARDRLRGGIVTGLTWSAAFAAIVGLMAIALALAGHDPKALVRMPLPATPGRRALFFLVGGIVGPAAEEAVFRGVVFSYLRRWGALTAVVGSTALFAAMHRGSGFPVIQTVGGLVFGLAYLRSGSLTAPAIIHMLGNLAIFTLSL